MLSDDYTPVCVPYDRPTEAHAWWLHRQVRSHPAIEADPFRLRHAEHNHAVGYLGELAFKALLDSMQVAYSYTPRIDGLGDNLDFVVWLGGVEIKLDVKTQSDARYDNFMVFERDHKTSCVDFYVATAWDAPGRRVEFHGLFDSRKHGRPDRKRFPGDGKGHPHVVDDCYVARFREADYGMGLLAALDRGPGHAVIPTPGSAH